MIKKELRIHLLLVFSWLLIITLLRLPAGRQVGDLLNLIWFWLGGFTGTFLIDLDHFIYLFFTNPHELTSQRAQRLWEQKRIKEMIALTFDTVEERIKLAFHNAFFQVILLVLCFFVLTSTSNLFGAGLVMSMFLHLLKDELYEWWRGREERLREWLFWPVKIDISFQQQKFFLILMLLAFLGLNFFLF